jgi:hypothetical protein
MTTILDVLLFKLQDEDMTTTSSLKDGLTINDIRVEYLNELIEKYNEGNEEESFIDYLNELMYHSASYIMVNLVTEVLADYYSQDLQEVVNYETV